MKLLCCESSTLLGSVAVLNDDRVLSYEEKFRQGSHSDTLNLMIDSALKRAGLTLNDIDGFVSGLGPGSFTGIRVSLNTIKTFGYAFNKPVTGVNSLQVLAYQVLLDRKKSGSDFISDQSITVLINAFKNMVYFAEYKIQNNLLIQVQAPQVVRVQHLGEKINEQSLFVGDGYTAYENYLTQNLKLNVNRDIRFNDHPQASALGQIARLENNYYSWNTLLPLYLRASEAEENVNGIKFQPL